MFGCQQVLIKLDKETQAILEYLCSESAKLSNCGIYYSRQLYFKTGRIPNRAELHKVLGTEHQNLHYKAFYSDTAQQILTGVAESFKSFMALLKGIKNGTVTQRPKLPGYRQSGMALVTFTGRSIKLKDGMLRFPLGSKVKAWFGLDAFFLPMPSNLDFKAIREYRILPRNGCFYLELIYKRESIQSNVNPAKYLSVDHGIDNCLADWRCCSCGISLDWPGV
jgi:transposase